VQVHPDDEYARIHEGEQELGKTECWYVIAAPPGAELVVGMKRGISREDFRKLVDRGSIEDGIGSIPVSVGDFVYIKSGTVHAILEGIMICEIQENSDSTYRLYDWGRLGKNGKPRPLHIEKALDVIDFIPENRYDQFMEEIVITYDKSAVNQIHRLVRGHYFNIDLLSTARNPMFSMEGAHFNTLNILAGEGALNWSGGSVSFRRGETILIPRPVGKYSLTTESVTALRASL
jgi:mannose-6-phosphate isomerase